MSELLADKVRDELRDRILDGTFKPGEKITDGRLDDYFSSVRDVFPKRPSIAPIREAFVALEAEQLLKVKPRVGVIVNEVTEQDVQELLDERMRIEESVISQLAVKRKYDLEEVRDANKIMRDIADRETTNKELSLILKNKVLKADRAFHEGLARAAGNSRWTEELVRIRQLCTLYSGRKLTLTGIQVRQFADEHDAILLSLTHGDGLRPDVNECRNAIRLHLRNSADRWGLEPDRNRKNQYYHDVLYDTPSISPEEDRVLKLNFDLLAARVTVELLGLKRLALLPSIDLIAADDLNQQMTGLAQRYDSATETQKKEIRTQFVNDDIGFHTTLMLRAGLQPAGEVVGHFWQRFKHTAAGNLDADHMRRVVREHDDLLYAIRPRRGKEGDVKLVTRCYLNHIRSGLKKTKRKLMDQVDPYGIWRQLLQLGLVLMDDRSEQQTGKETEELKDLLRRWKKCMGDS